VALADPTQSGSAAAAYEMVVQSGADWPSGWATLLSILGNAKRFYDGASGAADAVVSEAPLATCIDFYGAMRVAKYPDQLVYASPEGQTAFTPDPIAVLKNPPHPELAGRFVDFVLSQRGQALWALPVGAPPDGPVRHALLRTPIRKDVFTHYDGKLSPGISNPFAGRQVMRLDVAMKQVRFDVLKHLVRAAAIDNAAGLKRARKKLIDSGFEAGRLKQFNALPPDVITRQDLTRVSAAIKDTTQRERITTAWQRFFRHKYQVVAAGGD